MRRLVHLLLSPTSRLVRLILGEKRIACDLATAEDPLAHLPVFREMDGTLVTGLWAIIDHLENEHPDRPLLPADAAERAEALRLFDWTMNNFHEGATKRIVFEKGSQAHTGSLIRRPPNMETVRNGRQALKDTLPGLGTLAESRGFLAGREVSLADLALTAHLSALDYYGEVPWTEFPAVTEWYSRMKSRPSFRPLLADRVPGQPPVSHYAELDFETPKPEGDAREIIRARALSEGFDAVGFARAEKSEDAAGGLKTFLERGHHGDMGWMQTTADRRADPKVLWTEARSVITLGVNYAPVHDPLDSLTRAERGVVSVYAQGADYHDVLKRRLKKLASWIAESFGGEVKIFVDTAPVMEKPLAAAAGIGWQGKHTNLVSREFGSWLFLGSIFTTLELAPDESESDHCGTCSKCLDICPTKAFPAPYQIDARRCISYLTIEYKGHIPREFRDAIGNRIYGCDDCLAVCPWNKFAQEAHEMAFRPRIELTAPLLRELVLLDDVAFREIFRGSPIKRIGRDRFVRNVLIAIGNSGDAGLASAAEARLGDESPLVRAMAIWALSKLLTKEACAAIAARFADAETDPLVTEEWNLHL